MRSQEGASPVDMGPPEPGSFGFAGQPLQPASEEAAAHTPRSNDETVQGSETASASSTASPASATKPLDSPRTRQVRSQVEEALWDQLMPLRDCYGRIAAVALVGKAFELNAKATSYKNPDVPVDDIAAALLLLAAGMLYNNEHPVVQNLSSNYFGRLLT